MSKAIGAIVVGLALVAAVVGGISLARLRGSDRLTVVLPNAIGIVDGTPVQVDGLDVGQVTRVTAKADKALVDVTVDRLKEPLRAGTTATVEWRSVLGERYLHLLPGEAQNPVLPDGAIIQAGSAQVVVADLLQALDSSTRAHLTSLVQQLDTTMDGHQQEFNQTLQAAGPSVQALGAVLNAVGSDGQAIKTVLANLHEVTAVLAARRSSLSSTVLDLNRLTSTAAVHQQQLSEGISQLPGTLDSARAALEKVPAVAKATVPLLDDLRPAAARLPGVAANLSPIMRELRPTLTLLGPTLEAADRLLDTAPGFLASAIDTLPQLRTTVERAAPALAFLRPYTPELMGYLSGWGSAFSPYDSQGHYTNVLFSGGGGSLHDSPNITIPGEKLKPDVPPGEAVNQPWTDAHGSGPR